MLDTVKSLMSSWNQAPFQNKIPYDTIQNVVAPFSYI